MNIGNHPTLESASSNSVAANIPQKESVSAGSQKTPKVQKAIKDFEGVFMSMMIKELRQSGSEEGLFPGDASDTFGGLFDTFMGEALAAGKGIGLEPLFRSSNVIDQLEKNSGLSARLECAPGISVTDRKKAIEGYRNEQLRTGAIALP